MSTSIWLKKELASYIGITICGKCGTRAKMKPNEHFRRGPFEDIDLWMGYVICPKCGYKEGWVCGGDSGSAT